jgi:hypothetical protein
MISAHINKETEGKKEGRIAVERADSTLAPAHPTCHIKANMAKPAHYPPIITIP